MKRRVDRGGARIQIESAVRIERNQRAVAVLILVELLEREKLLHIKRGEAIELHRAEVAARALDPEHFDIGAGQRVLVPDLRRRVATAEVGDPLVAAKQI